MADSTSVMKERLAKLRNTFNPEFKRALPVEVDDLDVPIKDGLNIDVSAAGELKLDSGTTIATINCGPRGVVIGGESRVTLADRRGGRVRVVSDNFKKVFQIDNSTILAFSGDVGDGLLVRQYLKYFLGVWRDTRRDISAKGKVRKLAALVGNANIIPILAIWDGQRVRHHKAQTFRPRGGKIFPIMGQFAYLSLDFFTGGSGGDTILRNIREYCEVVPVDERNPVEAALLIYHMLADVSKDDQHSGGAPNIMIVDKDGVRDVRFYEKRLGQTHLSQDDQNAQAQDAQGDPREEGDK
jgi:20S proteasome alpha/beta subunit